MKLKKNLIKQDICQYSAVFKSVQVLKSVGTTTLKVDTFQNMDFQEIHITKGFHP